MPELDQLLMEEHWSLLVVLEASWLAGPWHHL